MRNSRILCACVGVLALRRKWDLAKRLGTIPAGTAVVKAVIAP